jgi:hypothetical protein
MRTVIILAVTCPLTGCRVLALPVEVEVNLAAIWEATSVQQEIVGKTITKIGKKEILGSVAS